MRRFQSGVYDLAVTILSDVNAAEDSERTRAGKDTRAKASHQEEGPLSKWKVEVMHNLAHNRRVIVGLVVAILAIAAIVLLLAYSGGGSGGGVY